MKYSWTYSILDERVVDKTSLCLCDQHKVFSCKFKQEWRLKGNGLNSDRRIPFDLWIPASSFSTLQPVQQQTPLTFGFWSVLPIGILAGERREKREWDRTIYLPGSVLMWLPGASSSLHQWSLLLSTSACYTVLSFPLWRLLLQSFLWANWL